MVKNQNLKALSDSIVSSIQDKKGSSITILDLTEIESSPASRFIICQGRSTSQVSSIADWIRENVQRELKVKPYGYDGYKNSQWIILDYGDLLVHIFLPEFREFYALEELWADATSELIPDID